MTTAVETQTDSRMQVLPSDIRIVRLGPGYDGWLQEYADMLRHQAEDFLRRAGMTGDPEGVVTELALSLDSPWRAVWLVLRPNYRLIGFAVAELRASFGQAPRGVCHRDVPLSEESAARGLSGPGSSHPRLGSEPGGLARHLRHATDTRAVRGLGSARSHTPRSTRFRSRKGFEMGGYGSTIGGIGGGAIGTVYGGPWAGCLAALPVQRIGGGHRGDVQRQ